MIPAKLRKKLKLQEGSLVIAEASAGGVLFRPARVVPITADLEDAADLRELRRRRKDPRNRKGDTLENARKRLRA